MDAAQRAVPEMISGRIENATRFLGKPQDWDDAENGRCGGLAIRDEVMSGLPVMTSAWTPTPAELARLNAGASVHLCICGVSHPPVSVTVGAPPA